MEICWGILLRNKTSSTEIYELQNGAYQKLGEGMQTGVEAEGLFDIAGKLVVYVNFVFDL